ncbi:MAG: FeoA family protein [Lachnospiraceae bacterium]
MKKLSEARVGEQGCIAGIEGDERFLGRVTSMGLTPGCPVKILQNEKKQPILIFGRDTMIALNRKECEKIMFGGEGE